MAKPNAAIRTRPILQIPIEGGSKENESKIEAHIGGLKMLLFCNMQLLSESLQNMFSQSRHVKKYSKICATVKKLGNRS